MIDELWDKWYETKFANKATDEIMYAWFADYKIIQQVYELHKPQLCGSGCCTYCVECTRLTECFFVDYPCDTIKALDGKQ